LINTNVYLYSAPGGKPVGSGGITNAVRSLCQQNDKTDDTPNTHLRDTVNPFHTLLL